MHWYGYHSQKAMGRSYGGPGMYLSKLPSSLSMGDLIWVVEGDTSTPIEFALVDCFQYEVSESPAPDAAVSRFSVRVTGSSLLGSRRILLDKTWPWFIDLHGRYITKQRFFNSLASEAEIVNGLKEVAGLVL